MLNRKQVSSPSWTSNPCRRFGRVCPSSLSVSYKVVHRNAGPGLIDTSVRFLVRCHVAEKRLVWSLDLHRDVPCPITNSEHRCFRTCRTICTATDDRGMECRPRSCRIGEHDDKATCRNQSLYNRVLQITHRVSTVTMTERLSSSVIGR